MTRPLPFVIPFPYSIPLHTLYENAIHRVRSCPSRNLIEHDVSDSATVVATTCGTNFTLPRCNITLWGETRYVMLLLNHSDRNAFVPRYFRLKIYNRCSYSEHSLTMVHRAKMLESNLVTRKSFDIQVPIPFRMLRE